MIRPTILSADLLATVLFFLSAPAYASDPRLASRPYNPDEVVRIEGRLGIQASIAFADDEHIENVAIGDSNSWQITPNKRANQLFVKPLAPRGRTNMTVVTDRHTYLFDLVASPAGKAIYVLRFIYPQEPKVETPQKAPAGLSEEEQLAVSKKPVDPAELNFAWRAKGKASLLPSRVYDDGVATYVNWAAGTPIPAILVPNELGAEGPVNFAVRGDVIVIDGVPELIVLRSSRDSATLQKRSGSASEPGKATQGAEPAALAATSSPTAQEQ
jgi:type IV secretion system protein VirB9